MQTQTSTGLRLAVSGLLFVLFGGGCSLQTLAVNKFADALASGGTTFASDEDPVLVGDALPFSLKLMETLLAESPDHGPLLVATARGFTQYTYGWVEPADSNDSDVARERSRKLYLRARDYGLRALSVSIDRFEVRFATDPRGAVQRARKRDVPALYWTAAAWGLAIATSKDDLDFLADLPLVEALIARAAALDPGFENGAIDTFLISYEASRAGMSKDAASRAREHFRQAVERSSGQMVSPFVAAAEALSVPQQDEREFTELLSRALAVDPNLKPEWRLQNILAQRRARWLLAHREDYFIESPSGGN
ncbi:MAG: hypothetical protein JJE51_12230 [Thermoanaerobaculia bacterium]|nr:hypothetical protein [Thermoanaerobaculia bacterium]